MPTSSARSVSTSTPTIIVDPTLLPPPTIGDRMRVVGGWLRREWFSCLIIAGSVGTMCVAASVLWSRFYG